MANVHLVNVNVPFPTARLAEICYDVLKVDAEPKRSTVKKELFLENNYINAKFTAEELKQIRVAVNGFFENINLILTTMDFAGPPVTDKYSHYSG